MQNRQIRLASRPKGLPVPENWSLVTEEVPQLEDGDVLMKIELISMDPAMRGWMNDRRSYLPPVQIGEVMRAGAGGVVLESRHPDFKPGDHVIGTIGAQEYYLARGGKGITRVDTRLAPLSVHLGVLGMAGLTAYFGLLEVGALKPGETVVVSGAAGAVGSAAGQIAKIKGCRVVGIAGGPDKCRYLVEELGFDAAIDYREAEWKKALRQACPEGLDIYFDNVGGETLNTCLTLLRMKARVVICGAISQYNSEEGAEGPSNYMALLVSRARMEGFLVFDYANQYRAALSEMAGWVTEGRLKSRESIVEGSLEDFNSTFLRLFDGNKLGKLLLRIAG